MNAREKEILNGVVEVLKRELNPGKIVLFGSRAKEVNRPSSDFDFAVDMKKPSVAIQEKISNAIEGVAGLYSVDVIYLEDVDSEFKSIVLKTGKVVYERN